MPNKNHKLRVFLCHASQDKPIARELYQRLLAEGWIDPWLDEKKLLPGQDWETTIEKSVESSHVVIVCLSNISVNKEGFVQREINHAVTCALKKPENTIFIIPLLLEKCDVPRSLQKYQYVNYFGAKKNEIYKSLLQSLRLRNEQIAKREKMEIARREAKERDQIEAEVKERYEKKYLERKEAEEKIKEGGGLIIKPVNKTPTGIQIYKFGGVEFVKISRGEFIMGSDNKGAKSTNMRKHNLLIPYDYYISRFPITNFQYSKFAEETKKSFYYDLGIRQDKEKERQSEPVVRVSWYDALLFVKWLNKKFASQTLKSFAFRLPSEAEWEMAARGNDGRKYPWGNRFNEEKLYDWSGHGVSVGMNTPQYDSPNGVADMAGNIFEWTRSLWGANQSHADFNYPYVFDDGREYENASSGIYRVLRGGALGESFCFDRYNALPNEKAPKIGFRIVFSPFPFFSR
jgi:formylglycine-generating enzyme required for sulfatase activity